MGSSRFSIRSLFLIGWIAVGLSGPKAWSDSASVSAPAVSSLLFLGDSHVEGTYGGELDRLLRTLPKVRVATYGVGGSTPLWYLEGTPSPWGFFSRNWAGEEIRAERRATPRLDQLLSDNHPRWVLISLGTNLLWPDNRPTLSASVERMVRVVREQPADCIWIGPPNLGPRYEGEIQKVAQALRATLSSLPCRWVDSFSVTQYPLDSGGDQIHYDSAGEEGVRRARQWAQGVFNQVAESLR